MAIAYSQSVKAFGSGTSVTTTGITTGATGSVFVRTTQWSNGVTFTSVTDSKSNSYTIIGAEIITGGTDKSRAHFVTNATGGASHTFTATVASSDSILIMIDEITGAATASTVDGTPTSLLDTASPYTGTAVTTTNANDLIWSAICGNSGSATATHAESTGFTIRSNNVDGSTQWPGATGTRVVAATSSYNCSWTETSSTNGAVYIAAFKDAGGGGGATAHLLTLLGVGG